MVFQSIYYPMRALTFPKFFVLYFFEKSFFNILRVSILSDINKKSSKYILTILVLLSKHLIKMLRSLFNYTNLILLWNAITFWFHSLYDYFRSHKLLNNLHKSFFYILQRWYTLSDNFIKIENLLFLNKLSRYTPTISS